VLRALTFAPTGAIVAAATTSLPECVGGERNWDYRYTWIRDASLTLQALTTASCEKEETAFFTFLARAAATQLDRGVDLQIMYGIGGERDLTERTLPHLTGWRDSAPVRIGNDAWRQRQLDIYGELLDAAHRLSCDTTQTPARRCHTGLLARRGRNSGPPLARTRPGDLGDPGGEQALPAFEADVLGGT
jgi:GH15 family glucan-1,4-alpha-glucosidase